MTVRRSHRIAIDTALLDLRTPAPLDGVVETDHHGLVRRHEGGDEQAKQAARQPASGPAVAVQDTVIVGEMRVLIQSCHTQGGRDGTPTGDKDRAHDQYHGVLPGRRGEGALEWPQPVGQNGGHDASRCVRHMCFPESMIEETRRSQKTDESLRPSRRSQSRRIQRKPIWCREACTMPSLCWGAWPVRPTTASRVEKGQSPACLCRIHASST